MSHMLEETRQQPETLTRILEHGLRAIRALAARFKAARPRLIVIAARGTSDNAAQFGRYLIEITTGIPVSLAAPSVVTLYQSSMDLRETLVIGISQSGESTDTNAVLAAARERGAVTVWITNEPRSAMARTADHTLLVRAGKEKSVAATKTYTGQLLLLYLLAAALGGSVQAEHLSRVPDWVAAALRCEPQIAAMVERYRFMTGTVTVGRGLNYANALEFRLKLMETCYVLAEGFSAADLMHGPIALVERGFPVFVFAPPGPTRPSIDAVLDRLAALKAETLVIGEAGAAASHPHARLIEVPPQPGVGRRKRLPHTSVGGKRLPHNDMLDLYTPIPYIVPAQLFAAHLAETRGLDPDRPRTLSKITRTM
jgi:glucosamine--fructose-6-phosphate aminotransferase (isomerizing)